MPSRPNWKGHLRLSLVSCQVALYNAATTAEKVSFHLLNGKTGHRLRRLMVDSETGEPVETADQIRGYEIAKGEYLTFEDGELDRVALESTHTIDIDGFVMRADVNDVYLDAPYYLVPNDKIGEDAFAVIRDAMRKRNMAGLARVVLYRRERVLLLEPHDKGIIATTLRFPYEIKNEVEFFGAIPEKVIPPEMMALAEHIIDTKKRSFEPEAFEDRYEKGLLDIIEAKRKGAAPRSSQQKPEASNVVDLMEALKRSVAGSGKVKALPPKAAQAPANGSGAAKSPKKPAVAGGKSAAPALKQKKAG